MKRFAVKVLSGAAILLAVVQAAAAGTGPDENRTSTNQTDPSQVVCAKVPAPTGTRVSGGIQCHTVKEWADMQRAGTDQLNMANRPSAGSTLPAGIGGGGMSGPR